MSSHRISEWCLAAAAANCNFFSLERTHPGNLVLGCLRDKYIGEKRCLCGEENSALCKVYTMRGESDTVDGRGFELKWMDGVGGRSGLDAEALPSWGRGTSNTWSKIMAEISVAVVHDEVSGSFHSSPQTSSELHLSSQKSKSAKHKSTKHQWIGFKPNDKKNWWSQYK